MDLDRIEQLARRGEMSPSICAIRLKAARLSVGLTQKDLAQAVGRKATAISNMERGLSFPSNDVMRYFYRAHEIGFDFIMVGDLAKLPLGVVETLSSALEDATNEWDQIERLNRSRASKPSGQN